MTSGKTGQTRYEWTPAFWKGWRERENLYLRHKSARDRSVALELVAPRNGERILEVGCGYGWVSEALWQAARVEWVGVDRSESMLRYLRPAADARPLVHADACQLPLANNSFDKVLCTGVLMHVEDDWAAVGEFARVLRPGGTLVVSINNAFSAYALPVRLHNILKPGFVQNFRRPQRLTGLVRDLGLQLVRTAGDGIFTTQSFCLGRFSLPPQTGFRLIRSVDQWLVSRFVWLAFEIWFCAIKPSSPEPALG